MDLSFVSSVLIGAGILVLCWFWLGAREESQETAERWLAFHEAWFEGEELGDSDLEDSDPQEDEETESELDYPILPAGLKGLPNPLKSRYLLLQRSGSALADGDLGRFLLRRYEVKGEAAWGSSSNLFVSVALAFTILGLMLTLFSLNVGSEGQDGKGLDGVLEDSLKHLPVFFFPTLIGVVMGTVANWCQNRIDDRFDTIWKRIDEYTITEYLPLFVPGKETVDESAQKLAEAAELFKNSGQALQGSIETLSQASSRLAGLDPTKWAEGLKASAETMKEMTDQGFDRLSKAAHRYESLVDGQVQAHENLSEKLQGVVGQLDQRLQGLAEQQDQQGEGIKKVRELLVKAEEYQQRLAGSLGPFQDAVGQLKGLKGSIDQLSADVESFKTQVATLDQQQADKVSGLIAAVNEVSGHASKIAEQASATVDSLSANRDQTIEKLERLNSKLESLGDGLVASLGEHTQEVQKLATASDQKSLEYLRELQAQLLEHHDPEPQLLAGLQELVVTLNSTKEAFAYSSELAKSLTRLDSVLNGANSELTQTLQDLGQGVHGQTQSFEQQLGYLASQEEKHALQLSRVVRELSQVSEVLNQLQSNPDALVRLAPKPKRDGAQVRRVAGLTLVVPDWWTREWWSKRKSELSRVIKPGPVLPDPQKASSTVQVVPSSQLSEGHESARNGDAPDDALSKEGATQSGEAR